MTLDPNAIVQVILVSPDGTHQDTVHAGALASVLALRAQREQGPASPAIQTWLDGRREIVVRWTRNLYQLAQELGLENNLVHTEHGSALALPPMTYASLPTKIAQQPAAGLDDIALPRDVDQWCVQDDTEPAHPMIVLNQNITMSTSQSVVTTARALTNAWLGMDADTERDWFDQGCALTFVEAPGPWLQWFEDLDHAQCHDIGDSDMPALRWKHCTPMSATFVHDKDLSQISSVALTAMAFYPTTLNR